MNFTERYLERELVMPIKAHEEVLKFFIEVCALKKMLESRNQKSFYWKVITHH